MRGWKRGMDVFGRWTNVRVGDYVDGDSRLGM